MTNEKIDNFLIPPTEKEQEEILAYNAFVRASAHTALEQIYKDALEYAGQGSIASMLVSRTVNLIYQSHHAVMLYVPELNKEG
jgi:hypothetical protein